MNTIHGDRDYSIARKLQRWVLLPFEFFKFRSPAEKTLIFRVILTSNFLTKITISKSNSKSIRVYETCTYYLYNSTSGGRATTRFHPEYSDWCIKDNRVFICKYICEDTVFCICLYHGRRIYFVNLIAHTNIALSPRIGSSSWINHISSILSAFHFNYWL